MNPRNTYQQQRRQAFKDQNLCYICGKNPPTETQLKCQFCIDKYQRPYNRDYRQQMKREVIDHYGGKCACCGETELAFLTIDHVNNDGAAHRKSMGWIRKNGGQTGGNMVNWLRAHKYPEGFQVLCWNCNCGKRVNNNICPHTLYETLPV